MPVAIRAISLTRRRPGTGLCTNMNVLDRFNRHYRLLATGLVAPLVVCLILLPFRDSVPNTSAALLLVGVGVAVTEIAYRGREHQALPGHRLVLPAPVSDFGDRDAHPQQEQGGL